MLALIKNLTIDNKIFLGTKMGTIQGHKKRQTPYVQSHKGSLM